MSFFKTADGTELFYKDWGNGKPVVFCHGNNLNSDFWEYQMLELAQCGFRCVAHDRRGHGRSAQSGRGYDFDTFADDLSALIERLDLREIVLVGHSVGGGEIARYLARHGSERVRGAVLVASTTPFLAQAADNPQGLPAESFEQIVAEVIADRPGYYTGAAEGFFGPGVARPLVDWTIALAMQTSMIAAVECVRAQAKTDFRVDMRAFTIPTLLIHGALDTAPVELTSGASARLIPGAELRIYEDAAHALPITHHRRLSDDIAAFSGR